METIIAIILSPVIIYLGIAGIYQLVLALAGQTKEHRTHIATTHINRFLVLVPAYQEDEVIVQSTRANMALKYQYPSAQFDYVVISDGLKESTNAALEKLGARVLKVNFEKSTKVKALQAAMKAQQAAYDAVVVLDADNQVPVKFLYKANQYINQGHVAIQGQRVGANTDTAAACLDAFAEAANNAMLCKGANRLGFSSKLSGSGMVFTYGLFEEVLGGLEAIGGFDKEMELALTQRGVFIKYAHDLIVTDEKVSSFKSYEKQRGRWLESQYSFLRKSIKPAVNSLRAGNRDHFHKAMQLALPPRALAPFALIILSLVGYWLGPDVFVASVLGLIANMGSYLITIPRGPLFKNSWKIVLAIPKLFWSTLKALTWMKRSKTEFLHTKHQLVSA